ncbi:cytochrome-c peroxidase [Helicobacter cappadocius]|uniref:Cytochrome-c peroxidase n=1 Tax=Helicobacter cappadocius TaxID=3063998 RepID=A0AA90TBL2_9HELI|nr:MULTISPECIES: cytochrome-c peroxidase [unclassified Helicobacter]MDO7252838.1 cytochrome-c peroxidase [Helicobacter sp. faydin-H75]MDP2538881.1 cytochrome-c peroxidase [Helicobacter sp. faydin-H76]
MKKIALLGSVIAFFAINTFAAENQELIKKAKEAGLEPIPSGKELRDYQLKKVKEIDLATGYNPKLTDAQIELGKKLYFDPRISSSNLISCNTCHNLALGGVDVVPVAIGEKWQKNPHHLNSPTVFNSVFNSVQFWDGRAHHLGDQAQGPIQNPVEMGAKPNLVVEKITSIPAYVDEFKKAYGNKVKIDFKLIADTIAMYETTLVTPSRYDDFLNGNPKALSKGEQEGLDIFIDKGCIACHNGINLGGTMQPFGVVKPYEFADVGDFKGDANGMVKVPTLRNIAETMPYFHNGQYWDVKDAIKEMGAIQLGISITDAEAKKIETFFGSLTGKKPLVIYPVLAPVTNKTPKPVF